MFGIQADPPPAASLQFLVSLSIIAPNFGVHGLWEEHSKSPEQYQQKLGSRKACGLFGKLQGAQYRREREREKKRRCGCQNGLECDGQRLEYQLRSLAPFFEGKELPKILFSAA